MQALYSVLILLLVSGAGLVSSWLNRREALRIMAQNQKLENENEELERNNKYFKAHIENVTRRNREALVGARVMVRSNEDEPIHFGVIISFYEITQAKNPIPIVRYDNGEQYGCLGAVLPYNEKILNEVKDLPPKEQWERLRHLSLYWE